MRRVAMMAAMLVVAMAALVVVAAPVSNQAGGAAASASGAGVPVATPAPKAPGALPGSAPMSTRETTPPALRTPAVDDAATSKPVPIDLPKIKDLHVLMEKMKPAHKKTADKNPEVARKAAKEVGQLALASLHPRFRKSEDAWTPLAEDLYFKNLAVQKALEPGADRSAFMAAYKAQNESCNACHRAFRVDD